LRAISARAKPRAFFSARPYADTGGMLGLGAREAGLATDAGLDLYLAHQFLPWRREGGRLVIAAADRSAANLAWLDGYGGARIVPIAPRDLHKVIARRFRERLSQDAVFSLWSRMPALSARRTFTSKQTAAFVIVGLAVAIACCLWPFTVAQILVAAMSAGFAVSAMFRTALALLGGHNKEVPSPPTDDSALPTYTILVPLYREAKILPELVRALSALDYPRDRLDIKLVVEEDDRETCAAAQALTAREPFEVLHVPTSLPRTKPKACNYGIMAQTPLAT